MPYISKAWLNYPPNVSTPINQPALIGLEQRVANYVGATGMIGPGVVGYEDFRVKQHGGGDMTVDVGVANTLMAGYIALDTLGGTERYEYNNIQLNKQITAADPANPRIDRVVLVPGAVDSQIPAVQVLAGTPTGGATLTNLTGAQVVPTGALLLANVLVAAAAVSILTASIQDARALCLPGSTSSSVGADVVTLDPTPHLAAGTGGNSTAASGLQSGYRAFLRRRIVNATKIRWKYFQGPTAMTGNYNIAIFDDSGRKIVETGVLPLTGALNTAQVRAETIPPTTFEAGSYYVVFGLAGLAGGTINTWGVNISNIPSGSMQSGGTPGSAFAAGSGGTTIPTLMSIGSVFVDIWAQTGVVAQLSIPVVALG